ncbi:MAG: MBL fold metallo-hydrolase [Methanomicrobia archaeon]|nr:MBL fold metallo-hydrolase [Methanomicrobia archaeon]
MFTKVSKSVYCRIGEKGDSNNGFILCNDFSVFVDTATYPDQTKRDLEDMKKVTDKKVKFLINTHYHPDHTFGNMYFLDIIAHAACRTTLKERIPFYKEEVQKEERFKNLKIKLPNIVFTENMMLMHTPKIELTHFGGHTEGSITVYVPEEKVLFSGDLLFAGYHLYLGDADIQEWTDALETILQWDIKKIIPGHGEICDKKEIKKHIDYLKTFYQNLKDMKKRHSKEDILKNTDLLELPEMDGENRIVRNIEAQYDKA